MIEGLKLAAVDVSLSQPMPLDRTEEDQFELAVRQYAQLVYRIAYSVLRNHHDAEDVAQEAFLRLFRHRSKLHEIHDLRAWMAQIAWRVAITRKRKPPDLSLEAVASITDKLRALHAGADEFVLGQQMNDVLEKLISALPRKLREPLVLSTVQELSPADVAKVLKTSEAAIRSRLFRARQILRERLIPLIDRK